MKMVKKTYLQLLKLVTFFFIHHSDYGNVFFDTLFLSTIRVNFWQYFWRWVANEFKKNILLGKIFDSYMIYIEKDVFEERYQIQINFITTYFSFFLYLPFNTRFWCIKHLSITITTIVWSLKKLHKFHFQVRELAHPS